MRFGSDFDQVWYDFKSTHFLFRNRTVNRFELVIHPVGFSVSKGRKFDNRRLYLRNLMHGSEGCHRGSTGDLFGEMVFHST